MNTAAGGGGGAGGDLDTEVPGEPGSIRDAASWLSSTAQPGVEDGTVMLARARDEASREWGGDAGPAFVAKMDGAHGKCATLEGLIPRAQSILTVYAGVLEGCQRRMAGICDRARAADLQVHDHVVVDPGPGPSRPPDRSGERMPLPELERYEAAVREYDEHQERVAAFDAAVTEAGEVRADLRTAQQQASSDYEGLDWKGALTQGGDWAAAAVVARLGGYQATALRQNAQRLSGRVDAWRQQMRSTRYGALDDVFGEGSAKRLFGRDAAHLDDLVERRNSALRAADDFDSGGRFGGAAKNISRGLVGVGIVTDLVAGESAPQALASNIGGYAAGAAATTAVSAGTSMLAATATGAALGSAVPVVGTAVGAVVGLGVGIFASGAIDSMFENGPDVGAAVDAGAEAVTDTVGAVGDGLEAAGDFVGGLF